MVLTTEFHKIPFAMDNYLLPWAVRFLGTQTPSLGAALPWVSAAPLVESRVWRRELFKCTTKKISDILDPRAVQEEQGLEKGSGELEWPSQQTGSKGFHTGRPTVTGNVRRLGLG